MGNKNEGVGKAGSGSEFHRVERYALWAGCVRKGHRPVLIRCSDRNLMLYCEDCGVVWGAGMSSLSYILASDWRGAELSKVKKE